MNGVLLLNATFEPINILPLPRALGLMLSGKADVVESVPGEILRSPTLTLERPSVLVLRHYVNVPRRKISWSRRGVFERDHYICVYCGKQLKHHEATLDHVDGQSALRRQGKNPNTWGNTVCACDACNQRKGDRSMRDAGMHFHDPDFEPKIPRTNYVVLGATARPEWRVYVQL